MLTSRKPWVLLVYMHLALYQLPCCALEPATLKHSEADYTEYNLDEYDSYEICEKAEARLPHSQGLDEQVQVERIKVELGLSAIDRVLSPEKVVLLNSTSDCPVNNATADPDEIRLRAIIPW